MGGEKGVMEGEREKKRVAAISILAALFLTGIKLGGGIYSNSLGILAEAAHSALDLLAAGITFWAIRLASRPADQRHAYGHGKAENLAALAETLILLFTCGWIMREAAQRLFFSPLPLRLDPWVILTLCVSVVVDINRARMLRRMAQKYNSQALAADALHFSTDILSSSVVIAGLCAVWGADFLPPDSLLQKVLLRADALAAGMVAVITARLSLRLGREAMDMLLDAGSADHLKQVETAMAAIPGVLRVGKLRLRESGQAVFIDMDLILPAASSLEYAHAVTEQVERAVQKTLPGADLTIHCAPEEDFSSDLVGRVRQSAREHALEVHAVTAYASSTHTLITLHAAVPGDTPLAEAHRRVDTFEQALRAPKQEIHVHLEPQQDAYLREGVLLLLPESMGQKLSVVLEQILVEEPKVSLFHRPRLLEISGGLNLSLHCYMPGNMSVRDSHETITRIGGRIQKALPELHRINIHADALKGDAVRVDTPSSCLPGD